MVAAMNRSFAARALSARGYEVHDAPTGEEALAIANDTPYGLAAYAFTTDLGRAWRVSEGLDYGLVGCNEGIMATEVAPFGGMKESGLGREGSKYRTNFTWASTAGFGAGK